MRRQLPAPQNADPGLQLPEDNGQRYGLERLRLYVSGTNLITITNYSWFDPEVNTFGNDNVALGTDFLTFPQAQSVVFGVNVGF